MREDTRLIWVETPTNPLLNVVDIAGVVGALAAARWSRSTTPSPPRSTSGRWSSAPTSSCTRRRSTSAVTPTSSAASSSPRSEEWYERLRFVQNSVGAVPGPFDCFLVHRGIRTLAVRMAAHARSAEAVVEMLQRLRAASDVRWPGFSGMVSFRHPDAVGIAARTRLFTLAESLGGVESLIEVPQAMTHQSVEGSAAAVPADLVRLSAGSRTRRTSPPTCATRSADPPGPAADRFSPF